MTFRCVRELAEHLRTAHDAPELEIPVDACPPDMQGDITVNCFKFARTLRGNPMQLATAVRDWLRNHDDVARADCVKAFVNVTITTRALMADTVADPEPLLDAAALPEAERTHVLVEYSAPNANKPQHLGHVRNNTLGVAICGLLERAGHRVSRINLVNDRGIAICKSMIAYQRFFEGLSPESTGIKGDHLIGDCYVAFDKELRRQLETLRESRPELADVKDEALFARTEIGAAAHDMLTQWEAGDEAVRALWRRLTDWVLEGFDRTYEQFGVRFDRTYFESDTYVLGKDIVDQGLDRGVFYRRDDGAVEIDLSDLKLDRKVVLRSDGTSVYVTQDLGTTQLKAEHFQPDGMIWIVGDEQIYHFKVLFAILRRLGYPWADKLHHLAYGMVHLPSGKMKSREGTVVDADDLYAGMVELARQATLSRYEEQPDDLDERARVIGLAALQFMLLKVNPKTTIKFDPEAAIRFEGDTGPYVLYACARIASMRRKVAEAEPTDFAESADWALLDTEEERAVAVTCARYGDTVQRAARELDPSILAAFLLDLTRQFNRFYKQHSVLSADTPTLRRTRLELCLRVQSVLVDGLGALGIETLEAM